MEIYNGCEIPGLRYHMDLKAALTVMFADDLFSNPGTGLCWYCGGSVAFDEHQGPCPIDAVGTFLEKIPRAERDQYVDKYHDAVDEYMTFLEKARN